MRRDHAGGDPFRGGDDEVHDATFGNGLEGEAPPAAEAADVGTDREEDGLTTAPAGSAELEDLRDRYLRLAAEYDNFRKRTERERGEASSRAQGQLVQRLLEAIDDLERVADFTAESTTVDALLEGVQMVERKLLKALESAGLERVDSRGSRFDPTEHEALM